MMDRGKEEEIGSRSQDCPVKGNPDTSKIHSNEALAHSVENEMSRLNLFTLLNFTPPSDEKELPPRA